MKKATFSLTALALAVILFDFAEGSEDFFNILDQKATEYLHDGEKNLHRSSSAAVSGPRNNKYLEASMQIMRGKI